MSLNRMSRMRFGRLTLLFAIALALVVCLPVIIKKAPRVSERTSQAIRAIDKTIRFDLNPGLTVRADGNAIAQPLKQLRPAQATGPLRVNPANPRYFTDGSGRAILLTGSHTWSNFQDNGLSNPPPIFDYDRYLDFLVDNNHNFFRLWVWEQARWSTETTQDYWIEPHAYQRSAKELALDGKPKFDLTQFNQVYFDRLRQRVIEAKKRGIYVSIMLFSGWTIGDKTLGTNTTPGNPWPGHPYNRHNNINGIDGDPNHNDRGEETHTLQIPAVTALQEAYVRKVIDTVSDLDNVLYEISNESDNASADWQYHLISYIKNDEANRAKQHPVGMTSLFPGDNKVLFASRADWISPNSDLNNPPVADGTKVIVSDTDHLCGICGDRQWVWKSITRGENPIFMDVYDGKTIIVDSNVPANPLAYQPWIALRQNLGYALTYAHKMNLVKMLPRGDLASTGYCLADAAGKNAEYLVYLPEGGVVTVDLSAAEGELTAEWLNPNNGSTIAGIKTSGGGNRSFVPPFEGDAVLYLKGL